MVKVNDLGYINRNLEKVPSKEEQKSQDYQQALSNLTSSKPPDRLSRVQLPKALLNLIGE